MPSNDPRPIGVTEADTANPEMEVLRKRMREQMEKLSEVRDKLHSDIVRLKLSPNDECVDTHFTLSDILRAKAKRGVYKTAEADSRGDVTYAVVDGQGRAHFFAYNGEHLWIRYRDDIPHLMEHNDVFCRLPDDQPMIISS